MIFQIDRDVLFESLSKVVPIAEKRSPLPILSHILLDVIDSNLILTATDLEVGLRILCDAVVTTPGSLAIPSRKALEIVRELPSGTVSVENTDTNRIRISAGQSAFQLAGMEPSDYPSLPSFESEIKFSVDSHKFLNMIEKTSFAASNDDSRFNLNGVLFEGDNDKIRLVATDGHRLASIEEDLGFSIESQYVVPKKGLNELKRLLETMKEEVNVAFQEKNLCLTSPKFFMSIRLVDGEYPDYRKAIPQLSAKTIKANRINFLQGLRRAAVLTSDRNKGVNIELSQGSLIFSVTHPDLGSARDTLAVDYDGENFTIIINVFYLIEALGVVDSDMISFEFDNEGLPIIIRPEPQANYFNLVMPMRK